MKQKINNFNIFNYTLIYIILIALFDGVLVIAAAQEERVEVESDSLTWWKGNLHTHTLYEGGDHFPEQVARWYKQNGYHFVSMTEHNVIQKGEVWIQPEYSQSTRTSGKIEVFDRYLDEFGDEWIDYRKINDTLEVRLKPLHEYRHLFEEPNRFLLIMGEEITDNRNEAGRYIHINAHNITKAIPPQGGETPVEVIQNNVDAVLKQSKESDRAMFSQLNHPNYYYAVAAEDFAKTEGIQFFEIFNGHGSVQNFRDEDLEKFWDIALTLRLAHYDSDPVYAVAVDDAHRYEGSHDNRSLSGRGWINVQSQYLTPEHIMSAMKTGNFYASTGVTLANFGINDGCYQVEIVPETGVEYMVKFIGTPVDHDITSEPVKGVDGKVEMHRTRVYSEEIGQVYKQIEGTNVCYELTGEELYIRAKIISTKKHPNLFHDTGEVEVAWTQPIPLN